jgi:hypothetical protein
MPTLAAPPRAMRRWQAARRALPSPAAYTAACGARGARSRRVRRPPLEREVTSAHGGSARDPEDGAGVQDRARLQGTGKGPHT